jgi:hypothetical protein
MDQYSTRLLETSDEVVTKWVERLIRRHCDEQKFSDLQAGELLSSVVSQVSDEVHSRLEDLLSRDVLEQRTNPLAVFRQATRSVTELLMNLGCPPVTRDEFDERSFPDDVYGLSPATWADIDEALVEPGIEWGAWKAATIMMLTKKS